jgi:PAS domain S-box-containing protein
MSPEIESLTGYKKEEFNDFGFKKIVKEIITIKRRDLIIEKEDFSEFFAKYSIITKSGEQKWVEDTASIRLDKEKNMLYSTGFLKDITPWHFFIEGLKNEKEKLNNILDNVDVIFLLSDITGSIVYMNNKVEELLGYNREILIGRKLSEIFTEEKRNEINNLFSGGLEAADIPDQFTESVVVTRDGTRKIIKWHNTIIRNTEGLISHFVWSGVDVTKMRKDEKVQDTISNILQAANLELNLTDFYKYLHQSIMELMPADNFYIAIHNKKENLISFPYFVDQFDKDAPTKSFGRGLSEYVIRTGQSALVNMELDAELRGNGEIELVGTQSAVWLGVPLKIQDDTIGVMVLQDYFYENTYGEQEKNILEMIAYPISRAIERKIVEKEKEQFIVKLKELNSSKDKLFSLISHDLRSPFNSLLGFAEILTSEFNTLTEEEMKEYLNVIYESSKNLYQMTNNLLQFSRFQTGNIEFKPVNLSIKKIVEGNLNLLRGTLVKKQLNLISKVGDVEVFADEDMLNSVVQNLLSNAIKFTNRGGEIRIFTNLSPNDDKYLQVRVEDTGIGMDEALLGRILVDHIKSSAGTEKEFGTGLGLLLVKEFVERNAGQISVKSTPHQGSTFIFSVPLSK